MKHAWTALLFVPLAGCLSFGAKPPKSLLTLTATSKVAAGTERTAAAGKVFTILVPSASAAMNTQRIPVFQGGTAVAYVKDAVWVDYPARQFQRLLSETVAAKNNAVVLDLKQYSADPGVRIQGALTMFGVDASRMEAVVTYDATILRGATVDTKRFEARVPVGSIDAAGAGGALNEAANTVAGQVADWVK